MVVLLGQHGASASGVLPRPNEGVERRDKVALERRVSGPKARLVRLKPWRLGLKRHAAVSEGNLRAKRSEPRRFWGQRTPKGKKKKVAAQRLMVKGRGTAIIRVLFTWSPVDALQRKPKEIRGLTQNLLAAGAGRPCYEAESNSVAVENKRREAGSQCDAQVGPGKRVGRTHPPFSPRPAARPVRGL